MSREMRRLDRKIKGDEECKNILSNNKLGILSSVSAHGEPYGVPLNYYYDGDSIYFHSAKEGHKIDNIKNSPKVSFCVVGDNEIDLENFTTKYESVIAFGNAKIVDDLEEKIKVLNGMMRYLGREVDVTKHYKMNFIKEKTEIVKIEVDRITGKRNSSK